MCACWILYPVLAVVATGVSAWNQTAAYQRLWGENVTFSPVAHSNISLLLPRNYHHELPPVPNSVELEKWIAEQFDLLHMDYKEFLQHMDHELEAQRRSVPDMTIQVDKATWLLELVRTVPPVKIYNGKDQCNVCRAGIGLLLHYLRERATTKELQMIGYSFCISVKAQSPRICRANMEMFMDEAVYIMKRISLTPKEICSFLIGSHCGNFDHPDYKWDVTLPSVPKPPVKPPLPPASNKPAFKVLHISDTHYDPYYVEGSNADCKEPLCCRLSNGPARSAEKAAGKWGDYRNCDTPRKTMENMLTHISRIHPDIDYIIWTGDIYPHNSLNVSKEDYTMVLRETANMLLGTFKNIPIFPAIGNHDTLPPNSFPTPLYNKAANISWLYEEMEKQWSKMLMNHSEPCVRRGAFYSVSIRPGFRIISLNTLFGYSKNGWLLLNSTDPGNMLNWLAYELQKAEMIGEKVHLIGHIAPGLCLKEWSRNYNNIVNRYESTITAQFFGHTHKDEFELFYDTKDKKRAVSIAYIGPSVTPFAYVNPGYRIYYVDGDHSATTRSVIDHETWVLNLNEANLFNYPVWYKLYSTRSAYKMQSLTPQEWDDLVIKMAKDPDLFNLFYTHHMKNSSVRAECDIDCKRKLLCDLRSGSSYQSEELCQEIDSIIGGSSRIHYSIFLTVISVVTTCYALISSQQNL